MLLGNTRLICCNITILKEIVYLTLIGCMHKITHKSSEFSLLYTRFNYAQHIDLDWYSATYSSVAYHQRLNPINVDQYRIKFTWNKYLNYHIKYSLPHDSGLPGVAFGNKIVCSHYQSQISGTQIMLSVI